MNEGFYYNDNGSLIYAANEVCDAGFHLVKEDHATYSYPVFGWYWFDSEAEAKAFFGL